MSLPLHILAIGALFIGSLTLAMGIVIVARKSLTIRARARVDHHAARYRGVIMRLLLAEQEMPGAGEGGSPWSPSEQATIWKLLRDLQGRSSQSRHAALQEVLAEAGLAVRGETLSRVTLLYEQCGFVGQVLDELRSRRWWVRAKACRDLGALRSRRASHALRDRLRDPVEEVRQEAALALVDIVGAREAVTGILQDVRSINPWFALRLAVALDSAAAETGESLVRALRSRSSSVRQFVAVVLGEVKDPASVPALTATLAGSSVQVRTSLLTALGKIGDTRALPAILGSLGHPDARIRKAALRAIGDLGATSATGRLVEVIRSGEIEERRIAAASLLRLGDGVPQGISSLFPDTDTLTNQVLLEALDNAGVELPAELLMRRGAA